MSFDFREVLFYSRFQSKWDEKKDQRLPRTETSENVLLYAREEEERTTSGKFD